MSARRYSEAIAGLLFAALAMAPNPGLAQGPMKVVGMLGGNERAVELFAAGLAEQGWIVGENVQIEHRIDVNDPASAAVAARDLIAVSPDAVYGMTTYLALALVEATDEVPVVFSNLSDPVGNGLVSNISQPGGNVTGFMFVDQLDLTRFLQLLLLAAPDTTTIGYVVDTTSNETTRAAVLAAATGQGLEVEFVAVSGVDDYGPAISEFASANPAASLLVDSTVVFWINRVPMVEAIREAGLPAIYFWRPFVEIGGLMSYGVDEWDPIRRAGDYVGRILNGVDPGTLPVQASTEFYLTLNLAAAAEIGLNLPSELMILANQIFE